MVNDALNAGSTLGSSSWGWCPYFEPLTVRKSSVELTPQKEMLILQHLMARVGLKPKKVQKVVKGSPDRRQFSCSYPRCQHKSVVRNSSQNTPILPPNIK